jgi:3-hydroxybutyryl-CoA dehydratase
MVKTYCAEDWVGRTARRQCSVTADMLDRFVELSGDRSPIHVDDAAARLRGFERRVAHGMLLGSLVSSVIGMELPGAKGVLHEVRLAFRKPCYAGDEVRIEVSVSEFFESVQTLALRIQIVRADGQVLATGHARSGLVE